MSSTSQRHNSLRADLITVLLFAAGLYVVWVLRTTLLLIYVGVIFAIIFSPAVSWIEGRRIFRWHISRGAAVIVFFALIFLVLSAVAVLVLPPISQQLRELSQQLPQTLSQLRSKIGGLPFGSKLSSRFDTQSLQQMAQSAGAASLNVFRGLAGGLMALLTIVLVTAYSMIDGGRAFQWGMSLVPADRRAQLSSALLRGGKLMQRWLIGQLVLMLILGSLTAIVLGLMKVRFFYAIAVFGGVTNFVPILGPIATVILASMVAAIDSWTKVLGVIVFYAAYQQVENAFLTPRIMRSTVGLPGLAIIIALLVGGALAGVLGALVAVPTAALVSTMIAEYLPSDAD